MASIYKRGKTWSYKVETGFDKDGKRTQSGKGGFRTKKEAEVAAAAVELEVANKTFVPESNISFRALSELWLNIYRLLVKESSVRIRKKELKRLYDYFDAIQIKKITSKQYQDALIDLFNRGYEENTIAGIHTTGRMVFKYAIKENAIKLDPTQFAIPPKKRQTVEEVEAETDIPNYLEKEELAIFLRVAHDGGIKDDYTIFMVLAYTGLRIGELCALKWSDIDFDNHTISITKNYYNPQNNIRKYKLDLPKTKASIRKITISTKIVDELKKHQIRQARSKTEDWHGDFVFTANAYPGYPVYPKLIEGRMARLLQKANLNQDLTPHSLRHTHTSLLAEAGVSLAEIMERLGHVDDDTTRKVYLHVTKTMKKEAVHKFDQLMDNL